MGSRQLIFHFHDGFLCVQVGDDSCRKRYQQQCSPWSLTGVTSLGCCFGSVLSKHSHCLGSRRIFVLLKHAATHFKTDTFSFAPLAGLKALAPFQTNDATPLLAWKPPSAVQNGHKSNFAIDHPVIPFEWCRQVLWLSDFRSMPAGKYEKGWSAQQGFEKKETLQEQYCMYFFSVC